MPTGYTAKVQDGTITEFKDFALECARAFGACITLRDEQDAVIPQEFKVDMYHKHETDKAVARKQHLGAYYLEDVDRLACDEYAKKVLEHKEYIEENRIQQGRYEVMLAKVNAWAVPTADHIHFRDFMLEQLHRSIDSDCTIYGDEPVLLTGEEWRAKAIDKVDISIQYHKEEWINEKERVAERNLWLTQLRESLDE